MRNLINLVEEKSQVKLELAALSYAKDGLEPVLSADSISAHYGKLARGYVDRFNNNEGDAEFNEAGAYLHNIFFPQLTPPQSSNKPHGPVNAFINQHFADGFDGMKEEFERVAMSIQGSGWVYLARNGSIKTIRNHEIKKDIVLLVDWWEHAWFTDYGADKSRYLKNIWKIIDWSAVNHRL
jgi:superoxide dismutase, Fe-Mn family